jgi:SmpA/OmlA family protein
MGRILLRWVPLLACAAMLLAACDNRRIEALQPGISTEADVRREFGDPENIWDGPGGARVFEYNRQPAGQTNYMVTIGPDGRMAALRQVLTADTFAQVRPGMKMEDVRKLLGKPARISSYSLKREVHYDWRYAEPPNIAMVFTVVFDTDYRVLRTGSAADLEAERGR